MTNATNQNDENGPAPEIDDDDVCFLDDDLSDEQLEYMRQQAERMRDMVRLDAAISEAINAAFCRGGFSRLERDSLLCRSLPVDSEDADYGPVFTRNGFAVIYNSGSYQVRVQATGELLAELPDRPEIAISFVFRSEDELDLLRVPQLDLQQRALLDNHARMIVKSRLYQAESDQRLYQAWLAEKAQESDHTEVTGLNPQD